MTDSLKNTRIEYHILQSFPVTCLNRDDVGAPKTAIVGGTTRARVSSQCWKRQVRMALKEQGVKLAVRTKHVEELLQEACTALGAGEEEAQDCAKTISETLVEDTLLFFSESEAGAFAEFAQEQGFKIDMSKKQLVSKLAKVSKKALNPGHDGLDIALFGRMVANAAEMNVEAAASFSHALSTHRISNEIDFFTALDDRPTEAGSAHMGSLEYNSATYYRYISLDLGQLQQTLEPTADELARAVDAFTRALFVAIPTARQATQSGASPWEFARVLIRKGQRLQVPFETSVKSSGGGFLHSSKEALTAYLDSKKKLFGSMFGEIAAYEWGDDENFSIDELTAGLAEQAAGLLLEGAEEAHA